MLTSHIYTALATSVLLLHGLFIRWVALGAILTHLRPRLRWLHIASLVWGILTEVLPWPCPLTLWENWLESQAGITPYQGGFLLHYMDKLVYPGCFRYPAHGYRRHCLHTESRLLRSATVGRP